MQATENFKDEDMTNVSLQTVCGSNGVIVDDKPTFKELFIDDEFYSLG